MTEPEHDLFKLDFDGDGVDDFVISAGAPDADGIPHSLDFKLDWDGDHRADAHLNLASSAGHILPDSADFRLDLTHDGHAEAELRLSDVDHDGIADRTDFRLDLDSDGKSDFAMAGVDLDNNMTPDLLMPESWADAIWGGVEFPDGGTFATEDPFMPMMETCRDFSFPNFDELWEIHGTPVEDMLLWDEQDDPNSCAVATTNMMFHSLGIDVGESELAHAFEAYGIYDPAIGTDPTLIDDVINDIAAHTGLPVHATEIKGFTEGDLIKMVDNGVRPLVSIDPTDLYAEHDGGAVKMTKEFFGIPDAGHAVQVTAIINSAEGKFVVLNDPGGPGGAGIKWPMSRFMDAAADFGFEAIALTRTT